MPRPLRLVAQDVGFSVRKQGFDSPRGYLRNGRVVNDARPFFIVRFPQEAARSGLPSAASFPPGYLQQASIPESRRFML